jgi:hypothetical protein
MSSNNDHVAAKMIQNIVFLKYLILHLELLLKDYPKAGD